MASDDKFEKDALDRLLGQIKNGKVYLDTSEEIRDQLNQIPGNTPGEFELAGKPPLADAQRAAMRAELESAAKGALAGPRGIDLVIFIGGKRRIAGKATIVKGVAFAEIDESKMNVEEITSAIELGLVEEVMISFRMGPLHHSADFGYISEAEFKQQYNFKPTGPFPPDRGKFSKSVPHDLELSQEFPKEEIQKIQEDLSTAGEFPPVDEPFKDKYPYGPL